MFDLRHKEIPDFSFGRDLMEKKSLQKMKGTGNQRAKVTKCYSCSSTFTQDPETRVLDLEGGLRTGIWGNGHQTSVCRIFSPMVRGEGEAFINNNTE